MAPLVLGHLALMIYAIQGGLSTSEILGRTQGSFVWFSFYGLFVAAVAVHAAIGMRTILIEWVRCRDVVADSLMWAVGLGLFTLGARAVWAVTFG